MGIWTYFRRSAEAEPKCGGVRDERSEEREARIKSKKFKVPLAERSEAVVGPGYPSEAEP